MKPSTFRKYTEAQPQTFSVERCGFRIHTSWAASHHTIWRRSPENKAGKRIDEKSTGKTLYIFDEPTTGLHFDDVKKLVKIFKALSEAGNSVIIIEHNLDVIKIADYIIDLGPEGGDRGGEIVFEGTPEECCNCERSYTGKYLKEKLLDV